MLTGHDNVVSQFVRPPLLQSHRCVGFHDMPHVLHQLADAASHLLRADADDHALWLSILRLLRLLLVLRGLLLSLTASSCHFDVSIE
jgi:hypothetical protein